MSDEKLLSALGRRAREQREEKVEIEPLDAAAERRIGEKILGSNVISMGDRRLTPAASRKGRVVVPLAFAAAAAALFFVWPRQRDLPTYAFELSGNVAEVRSDGPKVVEQRAKLHKEATLQIVLRPASPVSNVHVAAVLVRNGAARAWTPPTEISADGAVRIVGPVRTLFPDTDAPWEILVAVGESVPGDVVAAAKDPPRGVRIVRAVVEFVP